MIKKGYNLFTTSSLFMEQKPYKERCCAVCTSPFLCLCKPFCKYRKATYREFLDEFFSKKK